MLEHAARRELWLLCICFSKSFTCFLYSLTSLIIYKYCALVKPASRKSLFSSSFAFSITFLLYFSASLLSFIAVFTAFLNSVTFSFAASQRLKGIDTEMFQYTPDIHVTYFYRHDNLIDKLYFHNLNDNIKTYPYL